MLPLIVELCPYINWPALPEELRQRALEAIATPAAPVAKGPTADPNAVKGGKEPMAIFLARRDGQVSVASLRAEGYNAAGAMLSKLYTQGRLERVSMGVYRLPGAS